MRRILVGSGAIAAKLIVIGGLTFAVWASQHTPTFAESRYAYAAGAYGLASSGWSRLAEAGDPAAQYQLGVLYRNGQGVKQDKSLGLEFLKKAAAEGNPDAQYVLGTMYEWGEEVDWDSSQAFHLYSSATEKGHLDAQMRLALMYAQGQVVERDDFKALELLSQAAEQGHLPSQTALSHFHMNGHVGGSFLMAYLWGAIAARQRDQTAIADTERLAEILTDQEKQQADRQASQWRPTSRCKAGEYRYGSGACEPLPRDEPSLPFKASVLLRPSNLPRMAHELYVQTAALLGPSAERKERLQGNDTSPATAKSQERKLDEQWMTRYRAAVSQVATTHEALSIEIANLTEDNWRSVTATSLGKLNDVQKALDRVMVYATQEPEVVSLQFDVERMQRELRRIDEDNWEGILPDLRLLSAAIKDDINVITAVLSE